MFSRTALLVVDNNILSLIVKSVSLLKVNMNKCFLGINVKNHDRKREPFNVSISDLVILKLAEEANLCPIKNDRTLRLEFKNISFHKFRVQVSEGHSEISTIALTILLLSSTSYLRKRGFLAHTNLKNKLREEQKFSGGRNADNVSRVKGGSKLYKSRATCATRISHFAQN
jgi:hypothetical protein